MKTFKQPTLGIALVLTSMTHAVNADTVTLDGGDVVSGTIVSKADNVLIINTSWGGDIKINWDQVTGVDSANTAQFMLVDGTLMNASVDSVGDRKISLQSGEIIKTAPIALADIKYINPPDLVTKGTTQTSGNVNVGVNVNRGNTDNNQWTYNTEVVARTLENRFTIGARGEYKEENGQATEDNNLGYLKYDHFISDQWYGYATGDFEEDKFKDLNLRTTLGIGGGYQMFEDDIKKLSFELGASYVNEDYISKPLENCLVTLTDLTCPNDDRDDKYAAMRWATRYDHALFSGRMTFFHRHEILSGSENTFVRTQTGVRFPLVLNLNATLQANVDWQESPPDNTEKTDESYQLSIGYSF